MEFIWASGLAFIASGAFSILGKPFEEHPFASFETSVNSQLSNYDTRLNNALLPNQNLNQVGPPLLADAVRTEAQRAAALSALPQTATLTAIGYVVGASLGSGYAVLLVLAAV